MSNYNDIMHVRNCVSSLYVHLVFVSKYGCGLFDADAIERLLKGVSSRLLLERGPVLALLLRFIVRRRAYLHPPPVHRRAANAALAPEGRRACAILPVLNDEACRATGH